MATEREII